MSPTYSCEGRHDGVFGETASDGDGAAAEPGKVIAVTMGDLLDQSELTQAPVAKGARANGFLGAKTQISLTRLASERVTYAGQDGLVALAGGTNAGRADAEAILIIVNIEVAGI